MNKRDKRLQEFLKEKDVSKEAIFEKMLTSKKLLQSKKNVNQRRLRKGVQEKRENNNYELFLSVDNYLMSLSFEKIKDKLRQHNLEYLYSDDYLDKIHSKMFFDMLMYKYDTTPRLEDENKDIYYIIRKHILEIDNNDRIKKLDKAKVKYDYFRAISLDSNPDTSQSMAETFDRLEKADAIYFTKPRLLILRDVLEEQDSKLLGWWRKMVANIDGYMKVVKSGVVSELLLDMRKLREEFNEQVNKQRLQYGLKAMVYDDCFVLRTLRNCFVHNDSRREKEVENKVVIDKTNFEFEFIEMNGKAYNYKLLVDTDIVHKAFELLINTHNFSVVSYERTDDVIKIVHLDGTVEILDNYQKRFFDNKVKRLKSGQTEDDAFNWLPPKDNSYMILSHVIHIRNCILDMQYNPLNRSFNESVASAIPVAKILGENYIDTLVTASCLFFVLVNTDKHELIDEISQLVEADEEDKTDLNMLIKKIRNSIVHGRFFYDQYENAEQGGTVVFYDLDDEEDDFEINNIYTDRRVSDKPGFSQYVVRAELTYNLFTKLPNLLADCMDTEDDKKKCALNLLQQYKDFKNKCMDTEDDDSSVDVGRA